jgi:hypothetical protein
MKNTLYAHFYARYNITKTTWRDAEWWPKRRQLVKRDSHGQPEKTAKIEMP